MRRLFLLAAMLPTLALAADSPPAPPVVKAIAAKVTLSVSIEQGGKVQSVQPIEVQVFEAQFGMTLQAIADEAIKQAKEKK